MPRTRLLALSTLTGGNDAAVRDFKLAVLGQSGRSEVREHTVGGRAGGGRIRCAVLGPFVEALNAALYIVSGVRGMAGINELKDFLERVLGG